MIRPRTHSLAVIITLMTAISLYAAEKPTRITIAAIPGLKYDIKQFTVAPGANVELVFRNADTMQHNLVITAPGARLEIANAAMALGNEGLDRHYIPKNDKVLWATEIVPQGKQRSLRFKAPTTEDDYPYVCTYPGHGLIMYGTMVVSTNKASPVKNTPPPQAASPAVTTSEDPSLAHIRRAFMPDSGPASIAVMLPGGHSFCWDAGACRFRYAWSGGGLKSPRPASKGTATEVLDGDIYYRENIGFPIRLAKDDGHEPVTHFLGYKRDKRGVPEFLYKLDELDIRERVYLCDGNLVRHFRTKHNKDDIWFHLDPASSSHITSTGVRKGNVIRFKGNNSHDFSITIHREPVK